MKITSPCRLFLFPIILVSTSLSALTSEQVFAEYMLQPYTHPNIPNNSYAGYRGGVAALPDVPVVVSVTSYGAVGDGLTDNTDAFAMAIDAAYFAGGGAVSIPAGDYAIDGLIHMHRDGVVLRGAGTDLTRIIFRHPLQDVLGASTEVSGSTRWSFQGGLMFFSPRGQLDKERDTIVEHWCDVYYDGGYDWNQWWSGEDEWRGPPLADVVGSFSRGSFAVDVDDASDLRAGDFYLLSWENSGEATDYSLLKHIVAHPIMQDGYDWKGATSLLARDQWQWPVQIDSIVGNRVYLTQPLRIDILPEWNVQFEPIGPIVKEAGVEDLTLISEGAQLNLPDHQKEGYNAVFFTKAVNCWLRNVKIEDFENGIITRSNKFLTMTGIHITGDVKMHHAVTMVRAADLILEDFTIDATWSNGGHGLSVEDMASGNVLRDGLLDVGTFDSHRFMPFDTIRTNIDVYNVGRPGGDTKFGPGVGKNVVHWNVNIFGTGPKDGLDFRGGLYVNQPDALTMGALVGVHGHPQDLSAGWGMVPGNKGNIIADDGLVPAITDLYLAQMDLRRELEPWIVLAQPTTRFAQLGPVDLVAAANASGSATISHVEFLVDGVPSGIDSTAPYSISWTPASTGSYEVELLMTDSNAVVYYSEPVEVVIGERLLIDDTHPQIHYTSDWSPESTANSYGGSHNRSGTTGAFGFVFEGTRLDLYTPSIRSSGQIWDVYVDDLTQPLIKGLNPAAGDYGYQFLGWSSGLLRPGLHRVLILASGQRNKLDFVELELSGDLSSPKPPAAAITAVVPATGATPLTVAFDGSYSFDVDGTIVSYAWDFGNGDTDTILRPVYTFTDPGTYEVTLTVTDNDGMSHEQSVSVEAMAGGNSRMLVNWGGNYVSSFESLSGIVAANGEEFADDGQNDDRRIGRGFDMGAPLNPASGYTGTSSTFYGGIEVWRLNSTALNPYIGIENDGLLDLIEIETSNGSDRRIFASVLWKKEDFLNNSDETILFDQGSSLSITVSASSGGLPMVRFLVLSDGVYYISQTNQIGVGLLRLEQSALSSELWAVFDPTSNLQPFSGTTTVQSSSLSFTVPTSSLADIQAVGYFMERASFPGGGNVVARISGFTASGAKDLSSTGFTTYMESFPGIPEGERGPEFDYDKDGRANVREYYEGTPVDTANSSNTSYGFNSSLDLMTVEYRKDPGATAVTMTWESSGELTPGSWSSQSPASDEFIRNEGSVEIRSASFQMTGNHLFVRQRFTLD